MENICKRCGKIYKGGHGSYKELCNPCKVTKQRAELKEKAVQQLGGKCEICGYDKSMRALQFHHIDPTRKDFSISSKGTIKWESIKKEIEKCQLLCANCHTEIHENLDKSRRS
jgi:hypothetical protein